MILTKATTSLCLQLLNHTEHVFLLPHELSPPDVHSYSDDDSDSPKKNHSDMSLTELNQSLRMSLPRPKSGEFRKLFEGNSP